MSEVDKAVAESGDDTLGATVSSRGDGLVERRDLSDPHVNSPEVSRKHRCFGFRIVKTRLV